jgi:hypothetical protein
MGPRCAALNELPVRSGSEVGTAIRIVKGAFSCPDCSLVVISPQLGEPGPALTVKLAEVITRPVGSDLLYIQWSYIPCSLGMTGRVRQIQN